MSVWTNTGSSGGVLAGKEKSEEDDFLIVKGVEVPRMHSGKRWKEHFKNSQRKIITFYHKKALRKHQKNLEKQAVLGVSIQGEYEKPCTQSVKNPSEQLALIDDEIPNKIKVAIDYGYMDYMLAKELCKLATQIGRSYGHYRMKTLKDYGMRSHNLSSFMTFK